jgi:hypothetical protein
VRIFLQVDLVPKNMSYLQKFKIKLSIMSKFVQSSTRPMQRGKANGLRIRIEAGNAAYHGFKLYSICNSNK